MSLTSFVLIGSYLLILFNFGQAIKQCPNSSAYNNIGGGCYKIANGINATWFDARQLCENDTLLENATVSNGVYHLVAIENYMEKNLLSTWLEAYGLHLQFWTDGILSSSIWSWANQSIIWDFKESDRAIIGNGTNYKFIFNPSLAKYQIGDDVDSEVLPLICEYQVLCNGNGICRNNGTCYENIGQQICRCAPGFIGEFCEIEIDECLLSPCLHGGICIDAVNGYICNCSDILFEGITCETPKRDPKEYDRVAAFWSVLGVVIGLVVLLTLSDLPWEDILTAIGCSWHHSPCCSKQDDSPNMLIDEDHLSDSPTNDQNYHTQRISMPGGPLKGTNYHITNTVWDAEYVNNQTPTNPQYNGYCSPDQSKTFDNTNPRSIPTTHLTKQKHTFEEKGVYAVNIKEPTSKSKDPVDTMVNWTQQLQEQLKTKKSRETSASSTKQLIHSSNSNDY